jgi:uncharacterized membrane protein
MGNAVAIILHLLAINIWIGGTFFSVIVLPRAIAGQEIVAQHRILLHAFQVFFPIVWVAILMLLGSGGWMVFHVFAGIAMLPVYVLMMMLIAISMVSVFTWIYFFPFRRYRQTQAGLAESQHYLAQIRLFSKVNMVLGIGIVIVIGGGPYFMG